MMSGNRLPLALLGALALAALAFAILRGRASEEPAPAAVEQRTEGPGGADSAPLRREADANAQDTEPSPEPVRAEVPSASPGRGADQGFRGRVVDEFGTPVEGATLHLVEARGQQDVFTALIMKERGVVVPPVAKSETDRGGRFELGIRTVAPSGYDLFVTSDRHASLTVPKLTAFADRFVDIGDLRLPRGVTLTGRVTAQGGNGFPVPDARVTVRPSGILPTFGTAPDQAQGIEARTNAAGEYHVDNLAPGLVAVSVVAAGFAKVERLNVELRPDVENRVEFELPKGKAISGLVLDTSGHPVEDARVDAMLIHAQNPMTASARSDADGRFEVLGLVDGPYQIVVVADGYAREQQNRVPAGEREVRFVLTPQASVALRVLGRAGPLTRYDALLRAYHQEHDTIGHVPTARVEPVLPGDLRDGLYRLRDVDAGTYVVQIDADGYARSFSAPFTVTLDGVEPTVQIQMSEGGTLSGRVVGQDGRPIQGVEVATLPNFLEDGPFAVMIGEMVPHRITRASTKTAPNGRFELPRLAAGEYQIRIEHPDFATLRRKGLEIVEGETLDLGDIALARGTLVEGTVVIDGAPAGQVKVTVTSIPDPRLPGIPRMQVDAVSTDDGRFVLPRRIPPGNYQAQAARQTLPNPILQVVDYQNTRTEFAIAPGQQKQELHFTLKSD